MHQPVEVEVVDVDKILTTSGAKLRLANLYLANVMAFVNSVKFKNGSNEEEPNEFLMRAIESEAGIPEGDCVSFRILVVSQLKERRMDALYKQLEDVFDLMIELDPNVEKWLKEYQKVIPQGEMREQI